MNLCKQNKKKNKMDRGDLVKITNANHVQIDTLNVSQRKNTHSIILNIL